MPLSHVPSPAPAVVRRFRPSCADRKRTWRWARWTRIALASGAIGLSACAATPQGPAAPMAQVIEVTDGDTIVVRSGPHTEPVRLLGIDTPEVAHHGQRAECFGPEAAERTAALVPVGSMVRLDRDAEARDAFDRVLAYVTTADGVVVNLALAAEGFATPLAISPNYALADTIAALSAQASAQGLGLWGACPADER